MKIEFLNEEKQLKVCFKKLRSFVIKVAKFLQLPANTELSISFVKPSTIQSLNKDYRKKDSVTDVLSFPSGKFTPGEVVTNLKAVEQNLINHESGNIFLGDIIVCTIRANEQAIEYGNLLEDEVFRLVLHSILHLIGYNHENDKDYQIMHQKEMEILKSLGYNFSI